MKTLMKKLIIPVLFISIGSVSAQTINWASLNDENKHIVNANLGFDYGVIYGLGYGQKFNAGIFPIVASAEFSMPSGNNLLDDFKAKAGAQVRWIEFHNFQFSTKIYGVFRRYENDFVRQVNFGSDLTGIIGYYRSKWFVSGEIGFDKAIVSQFKHSKLYRDINPTVLDGWYEPSIGGNFYYGLQAGYSIGENDIILRAGKILTQDFKTTPTVPFFLQLGYNRKF